MTIRLAIRAATAGVFAVAVATSIACVRHTPKSHVVTVKDFTFQPPALTVSPGDTIVWTNSDVVPHTATASDSSWDSKTIAAGGTWRLVASTPGNLSYYCVFHPNMKGTIEVR
jgi:plastocyanin